MNLGFSNEHMRRMDELTSMAFAGSDRGRSIGDGAYSMSTRTIKHTSSPQTSDNIGYTYHSLSRRAEVGGPGGRIVSETLQGYRDTSGSERLSVARSYGSNAHAISRSNDGMQPRQTLVGNMDASAFDTAWQSAAQDATLHRNTYTLGGGGGGHGGIFGGGFGSLGGSGGTGGGDLGQQRDSFIPGPSRDERDALRQGAEQHRQRHRDMLERARRERYNNGNNNNNNNNNDDDDGDKQK